MFVGSGFERILFQEHTGFEAWFHLLKFDHPNPLVHVGAVDLLPQVSKPVDRVCFAYFFVVEV